jgi:hypothetical protein
MIKQPFPNLAEEIPEMLVSGELECVSKLETLKNSFLEQVFVTSI